VALTTVDRAEWEASVSEFGDYSYRQSWAYGVALASKRGAASEHVAIRQGAETLGLADVRVKRAPVIGGGLAFVSGGPLVRLADGRNSEPERLAACVDALVDYFVRDRGLKLRLMPAVGLPEQNESVAEILRDAGLRPAERAAGYQTVLLDLERPLEDIRASLHQHWRRQLKKAEGNPIEVSFGTGRERFEHVARMSAALGERKGFELDLDAMFYADVQADLREQDRLLVGLVCREGAPVAGTIIAVHGDTAVYLVGASTDAGRESRAAYLLHWRTIELLRERGVAWYDLGGIDPVANPGVTSFKLRTGGADVATRPFELSPGGLRGRATDLAERAYARTRRARGG
jgi:lipid II:glycine glycyltransferase (peptidoglycan interpeptide bridge formation enzyme)